MGKAGVKRNKSMDIYEKVKKYLIDNIGHLTTPGTPRFDSKNGKWKVPVLCKTDRGILISGEFQLDSNGCFLYVPTKQEMLKTIELQIHNVPYLFYGKKERIKGKEY
jgi:hypothetical protein